MGRFLRANPHSWKNPTKSGGFFEAILPHELNNPDKIGKLPYGHHTHTRRSANIRWIFITTSHMFSDLYEYNKHRKATVF